MLVLRWPIPHRRCACRHLAIGTHRPRLLFMTNCIVRCLALSDGETKIAFAICDNFGIPNDVFTQARRLIADVQSIVPANVVGGIPLSHILVDYFGPFAEKIGMKLGADESFVGMLSNGTSDVNNTRLTEMPMSRWHRSATATSTRKALLWHST